MHQADQPLLFDDRWYAQVPNVHRWLAGDRSQPFHRDYPHDSFNVEFWFAPFYVMKAILGWRDCAAGVAAVFDEGAKDGPAAMLDEAWGRDIIGSLAWWAWKQGELTTRGPSRSPEHLGEVLSRFEAAALHNGFGGGSDPFHLIGHLETCIGPYQGTREHRGGPGAGLEIIRTDNPRRVAMIVERFEDWPVELGRLSRELPPGRPSWHVHVTARRFGWVGRFRRCWHCGRWFQGPSRVHAWGHAAGE